ETASLLGIFPTVVFAACYGCNFVQGLCQISEVVRPSLKGQNMDKVLLQKRSHLSWSLSPATHFRHTDRFGLGVGVENRNRDSLREYLASGYIPLILGRCGDQGIEHWFRRIPAAYHLFGIRLLAKRSDRCVETRGWDDSIWLGILHVAEENESD